MDMLGDGGVAPWILNGGTKWERAKCSDLAHQLFDIGAEDATGI
jgi:hypothetical protein